MITHFLLFGKESLFLGTDAVPGASEGDSLSRGHSVFIFLSPSLALGNHETKNSQIPHLSLNQQDIY